MARVDLEWWATRNQMDCLMNPVGDCEFAVASYGDETVTLKWADPEDAKIEGRSGGAFTFARWRRTVVVKKLGSSPSSETDGTVVVTNTVRDQYRTAGYTDEQAEGEDWFYAAFATADTGIVSKTEFKRDTNFGFYIDESDPVESTAVHYTGANAGYSPAYMDFDGGVVDMGSWANAWFFPRPCMLASNGTVAYYLNPDNYKQKADGTPSDVTNTAYDGNAMLEWPRIFSKTWRDGDRVYAEIAQYKKDKDFECWPCLKADGTYADHFYTAIYEGSVINGKLRSMSTGAVPQGNNNATNELAYARANGEGWSPTTWADESLFRILVTLLIGRLNSQEAFGSAFLNGASGLQCKCGQLDDSGMFFGTRFDGSTQNLVGCKLFGMEQPWGSRGRRCVGLNWNGGQYLVKMTPHTLDGSTVEGWKTSDSAADYSGYIATGVSGVTTWSASYITKIAVGKLFGIPIEAGSGSSTTYYSDGAYGATGLRCAFLGGAVSVGSPTGLFYSHLSATPSTSGWSAGASLSYHHL